MADYQPPRGRSPVLYPVVATGMWVYANLAFDVSVVGPRGRHPEPGTLYIAPHRAETDVPIVCGSFYISSRSWSRTWPHLHFAARDDLFEPGFFAGFIRSISPRTRRRLHGLSIESYLPCVQVRPIRSATSMRLMQAVAAVPGGLSLAEALPEFADSLAERARILELPPPTTIADIRRGEFADLLWVTVDSDRLSAEAFADAWRRRAAEATTDLRSLIDLIRAGEPLLLFPEGRPSQDGAVGPIQRGLGVLTRRGKPDRIRAFTIAYDTLSEGRTAVCVSAPSPVGPLGKDAEAELDRYLARTFPATVSQFVARALVHEAAEGRDTMSPSELAERVRCGAAEACAAGRPLDRALVAESRRVRRLDEALRTLARSGAVVHQGPRRVGLNRPRILSDPTLARLVKEDASVQAATRAQARGLSG